MQRRPIDPNRESFAHQQGGGSPPSAHPISPPNTNNDAYYHNNHHNQASAYLSPQHNYNLLDDDENEKKKRSRGFIKGTMMGGNFIRNAGTVLSRHFKSTSTQSMKTPQHEGQQQRVNPFAVIFFLLFAFSYFRWSQVSKKFDLFKSNADGSMRRFKELSGSRERRCLETLEDREREMGELRATVHSKEKDAEDATHKFNACELKLSGHHEEKKLSGNEKSQLKEQLESLRHEKENLVIEMSKWKDEAESAKDELATLKKHHELEKHDASVKHEADLGVMDEGYNAVIDSDGVLHEHTDEEYEELKRAFEAVSKKHNLEHKEFYYESSDPNSHHHEEPVVGGDPEHREPLEPLEPHPGVDGHNNVHHVEHVSSTEEIPNHRKSGSHSNSHEGGGEDDEDIRPLWERYADVAEETLKTS